LRFAIADLRFYLESKKFMKVCRFRLLKGKCIGELIGDYRSQTIGRRFSLSQSGRPGWRELLSPGNHSLAGLGARS
jgi:hypothetical protein